MTAAVLLTFVLAAILLLLSIRAMARTGVPVVTSPYPVIEKGLDLLALRDGERFADIGCAFGRVLVAARRRADVQVEGFELNPSPAAIAALRTLFDRKVRIRIRDARRADLRCPDAVYVYLMPAGLPAMADVLERNLREGARVVSVDFPIPGWRDSGELSAGIHCVRLYVMGEHRERPEAGPLEQGADGDPGESRPPS